MPSKPSRKDAASPGPGDTPEHLTARLEPQAAMDAPSAAAAGEAPPPADPECPVPVTAWTSPEDAKVMASGLKAQANPAEWAFARLSRLIEDFESKLDEGEEVGARIVGTPGDGVIQIEDVGFWGPDLILFFGRNQHGKPVRLVQHYTQLNVMLSALPKEKPAEPPRRIGFQLRERLEQATEEGAAPEAG